MSLSKKELIDIKNAFIFSKWVAETFKLDPRWKLHAKIEAEIAIVYMTHDFANFFGDGWTTRSPKWLEEQIQSIKKGDAIEMKHLKQLNCIEDRPIIFQLAILEGYKNFLEDDEWYFMKPKEIKALDNDLQSLKKYEKKYVKLMERLWKRMGEVPGWVTKYWKIVQSKN